MTDYHAKTLKDAFRLCDIDPLVGAGLERYYVNLTPVRKTEAIDGINTILEFQDPGDFCTLLFTGHRGCGKSTELQRIRRQWEQDYRVIYTVPISVLCSSKNIVNTFGEPHIVSMVNVYQLVRDRCTLNYNSEGIKCVAEIVEKRVDTAELFESETQVMQLVQASGGHVRQLMQMVRSACQTASTRKHTKIQPEDVDYAVRQQQFNFERFIPDEHYPLLAKVCLTKNITKDAIGQLMLFNTSVLEYNGLDRWNYPNPAVLRSELFQRALREISPDA
ncbi:MAG: ATP-binding protein [Leptolyngbyaceae cyanobacterium SL_7_1]|nr:ATP-binding protein [Leptolyngbyaceae cyanobacterium SL_7_1]